MSVGLRLPWKKFDSDSNRHERNVAEIERWARTVSTPVGMMSEYAGSTSPAGWLLCDGSAVDRNQYMGLFNVIGTTFGVGDGSTTFNLPDMRQRFPLGKAAAGTGSVLGATGGAIDHTHTITSEADHQHGILLQSAHDHTITSEADHSHSIPNEANAATGAASGGLGRVPAHNHGGLTGDAGSHDHGGATDTAGAHNHGGATESAGSHDHGGATASGNPPYQVVNYIIKI